MYISWYNVESRVKFHKLTFRGTKSNWEVLGRTDIIDESDRKFEQSVGICAEWEFINKIFSNLIIMNQLNSTAFFFINMLSR